LLTPAGYPPVQLCGTLRTYYLPDLRKDIITLNPKGNQEQIRVREVLNISPWIDHFLAMSQKHT
jgi:hypothetical protein